MNKITILNKRHYPAKPVYPIKKVLFAIIFLASCAFPPASLNSSQDCPCLSRIDPSDAILISGPDGRILCKKNETEKYIPASTLKMLTALTAIHHFGFSYRFKTGFYTDADQNIIIKGYGDPLLISEIWKEISEILAKKIQEFNNLILDDSYFSQQIKIPGKVTSANPYDAPPGALCANFNTVFFDRDKQGKIITAEPQTPLIPFAVKKIRALGKKKGRYTFSHSTHDAARYAGELFLYFMKKQGVKTKGEIITGSVGEEDRLIYTYHSIYTLETVLQKMLEFSNNFTANQICIAMGAHEYGTPGTISKGVRVISDYAKKELNLQSLEIVEGSGISRKNRISPLDMLTILEGFKPYRHILKKSGPILFKTGTLKGINTRAGYIENSLNKPCCFVVFLNSGRSNMKSTMKCIETNKGNPR